MDTFVHVYYIAITQAQSWHNFGMAAITASPQLELFPSNSWYKSTISSFPNGSSHQAVTHDISCQSKSSAGTFQLMSFINPLSEPLSVLHSLRINDRGIDDWWSISLESIYTGFSHDIQKYSKAQWIVSGSVFAWSIMVLPDLFWRISKFFYFSLSSGKKICYQPR